MMTNAEAKKAFLKQCPVVDNDPKIYGKIIYKCISVIGFKFINGNPIMFCECQDCNGNSSTILLPQQLSEYEGDLI